MKTERKFKTAVYIIAGIIILRIVCWLGLKLTNTSEAASIGIIGGADGPTAIYLTTKIASQGILKAVIIGGGSLIVIFVVLRRMLKGKSK